MKRTKIIIYIVILFLIILALVALKEYLTPKHKFISTTLCSQNGECIDVILDVTWHRHLFAPTELKGTVTVGDKVYQSIDINGSDNFIERLNRKFHPPSLFYFRDVQGDWFHAEQMQLHYADRNSDTRNFNLIYMSITPPSKQGGVGTFYFGPATTVEEVDVILSKSMVAD